MGTVGNMQSLKPLVLLILGGCFVKGDYWWMGEGDAFGGNSDTQVKRASCGGYGGGCGSKKTQTVGGYPQNGAINTQNTGGYPQNTGGYPSNSGGYPQIGGNSQSNENIIQSAPITDPVQNVLQYDGENSQSAPDNIFNDSQDYPSFNQPRDTPADYPATNTQRIVFPQDDEETSFPTFSQTSLSPYTDTTLSSVSKTQPLTVIQPNPIPVQQQVQVNQPYQASVQQPVQVIQPIPVQQPVQIIQPIPVQQPVQVFQPNPIPVQQLVQAAASQPFITCPSAMKCVQKITCN